MMWLPEWFYTWHLEQLPEAVIAGVVTGLVVWWAMSRMNQRNKPHCSSCCPNVTIKVKENRYGKSC